MTPPKRSPIPERKELKPCFLREDYGAGQSHMSPIHAYNPVDAERKDLFLSDARRYLRSVGEHLRSAGFHEQCVRVNPGGIAVSGEAYGCFYRPGEHRFLFVELGTEMIEGLTPREDQVSLFARWEEEGTNGQGSKSGQNNWLNPSFSSAVTAKCLLILLSQENLAAHYWWWLEDGTLYRENENDGQDPLVRQWQRHQREKKRRHAWQDIPLVGSDMRAVSLRDDYTTRSFGHLQLEVDQPLRAPWGKKIFLDRDLCRDARRYLETLACYLAPYGFTRRRIVEQEQGRFVWGDYLGHRANGEELQVRVKIGPVGNRGLSTRDDRVIVFSCTVPPHWKREDELERGHERVHLPLGLDTQTLALQLVAQFDLAPEKTSISCWPRGGTS